MDNFMRIKLDRINAQYNKDLRLVILGGLKLEQRAVGTQSKLFRKTKDTSRNRQHNSKSFLYHGHGRCFESNPPQFHCQIFWPFSDPRSSNINKAMVRVYILASQTSRPVCKSTRHSHQSLTCKVVNGVVSPELETHS
jgi:hypothetical protein